MIRVEPLHIDISETIISPSIRIPSTAGPQVHAKCTKTIPEMRTDTARVHVDYQDYCRGIPP
jgi:hypothetical protein